MQRGNGCLDMNRKNGLNDCLSVEYESKISAEILCSLYSDLSLCLTARTDAKKLGVPD